MAEAPGQPVPAGAGDLPRILRGEELAVGAVDGVGGRPVLFLPESHAPGSERLYLCGGWGIDPGILSMSKKNCSGNVQGEKVQKSTDFQCPLSSFVVFSTSSCIQ